MRHSALSPFRILRLRILLIIACVGLLQGSALAQNIPTPESVLGFKVGADFHLATYEQAIEYWRALEKASPMIRLQEIGKTSMGKPMYCAIITSAENMKKLDRLREISEKLALAQVSDDEARQLAAEGRAVVYIDGGLHATEVAPAQHNIQLAYDLLASDDADTRQIRENTILLLNFANPDGMDIVADWYNPHVGTPYEVSPLPKLYHLYAGHDNNRDAYMLNLSETRAILEFEYRKWYPVLNVNHHQTAPFPTRISIPPLPEPVNPNVHPLVTRWKNMLGTAVGTAFDRNNQPGAIARIVIDGWAPEMLDSIGDLFNTPSTSPETALYQYATPRNYDPKEFPAEYRDFTPGIFYPSPWKGGWWRLRDAVDYVLTFSKATLQMAAVYREKLLLDKYRMGRDVITRFAKEPPYAWIIPQDQWDPPVAATMLNRMMMLGIKVSKAQTQFSSGGRTFPAGTWVIPMQQPFAAYVKSMFEEQKYPDMTKYPQLWQGVVRPTNFGSAYLPPYDTAGWTLPYQMGVKTIAAAEPMKADLAPIDNAVPPAGSVEGAATGAYLLPAQLNNSFIAINRVLKAGGDVSRARKDFTEAGHTYVAGTWIVRAGRGGKSLVDSAAKDLSLKISGVANTGTTEVVKVKAPRIALYQSWVPSMDEGWTRWLLEQYEFPYTTVHDSDIRKGGLASRFDVIVIPDQSTAAIVNGHKTGSMPPEYVGGVTDDGVANIRTFIEEGGTLVLLNGASHFAADALRIPVTDGLTAVRARGRSSGFAGAASQEPAQFAVPSSVLRMVFDPTNPVAYGMPADGAASFINNSIAFDIPQPSDQDKSATTKGISVIARYPTTGVLLSGFMRGENYLAGKPSAVEAALGKGKVIMLGFAVQHRAQPHGTFKLLFNSLYYATSSSAGAGRAANQPVTIRIP